MVATNLLLFIKIYLMFVTLFIGSFLNVVALRIPIGESIVFPSSHCTTCNHKLGVLDLIPVFSYLLMRGRCRYCGDRVSPIYPVFEVITAIGSLILFDQLGLTSEFVVAFVFWCVLITVTITDLKFMLVPDKILLPGFLILLVLRAIIHPLPLWQYIVGFFAGGVLLLLIAILSRGGMGGGDIKLFAVIGLSIGLYNMLLGFFLACMIGTIFGLIFMILGIYKRKQPIAFVPYITIGCFLSYVWGNDIWQWYSAFFR